MIQVHIYVNIGQHSVLALNNHFSFAARLNANRSCAQKTAHGNFPTVELHQANSVDADKIVSVPGEEGGTVGRPGQGNSVVSLCFRANRGQVWLKLSYDDLRFKIP